LDAIERDFYEERRRRWRRSAFWRGFLVAVLLLAVVAGLAAMDGLAARTPHIARYAVSGVITDDPERDDLLRELAGNDAVRAVLVRVDSPGGSTVGSEALFAGLRRVAERKPVVAVMGEVAASGGYIAALAADYIVARGNSITGSIGVILEYPDFTELMDRLGIGLQTVRSSELKAEPSPFRPTTPEARAREIALVADSYAWFRDLVAERRGLSGEALDAVTDGGVFTGRLAFETGLVDALGGEPEALAWLEAQRRGLADLPMRDWSLERDLPLPTRLLGSLASTLGFPERMSDLVGPKLYSLGF
jgi:protease-4